MRGPSEPMVKWWMKTAFERGRVTQHLSPNQVHPVQSLIKTMPQKTILKLRENGWIIAVTALAYVGTVKWAVAANDAHHREHWS